MTEILRGEFTEALAQQKLDIGKQLKSEIEQAENKIK